MRLTRRRRRSVKQRLRTLELQATSKQRRTLDKTRRRGENSEVRGIQSEPRCEGSGEVRQRISGGVVVVLAIAICQVEWSTGGIGATEEELLAKVLARKARKIPDKGQAKPRGLVKNHRLRKRKMSEAFN